MDLERPPVRLDKWLWAIRLFKSRSLATAACNAGKVMVNGQISKPSRAVQTGDRIEAVAGEVTRTVRVTALLDKRVGPKLVGNFREDLTPPEELNRPKLPNLQPFTFRPKGTGRPTKKERRNLDNFLR